MAKKKKENSIEEDILKVNKNKIKEDDVKIDITHKSKIKGFFSKNFNNKFKNIKIKYKKDPKKFVVATLGLLLAFSALVGSSYAYLTYISKTDSTTVISAGTLALTFNNETNAITLDGALPVTDEEGLTESSEYTFQVKNTGSIPASYKITLDSTCNTGNTYTINNTSVKPDLCIPNEYIKVGLKQGNGSYKVLEKKPSEDSYILEADSLGANKSKTYTMKIWLDYNTPNDYNSSDNKNIIYVGKLGLSYEQGDYGNLDTSGANKPELDNAMIPVYYDETEEVWKKADSTNKNSTYQWYDYDNKMWANSVTVSSTNRSTYQSAELGTTIPMDDILTMQVWIPRYKYKVWNYNEDGIQGSEEQEIEVAFEDGTAKTGEITCQDNIQGLSGDGASETCKLKITNETCTDSTCNNKTYTHPAFTFGGEEIKGFWIGKFELTGTIDSITTKPNLQSLRSQTVSTFETNIMNMNTSNNIYGLSATTDTHMIKNMEWGAVVYLSHSKYGTCTDGTCKEVNINNSFSYYTGNSGGGDDVMTDETYKYNQTKKTDGTIIGAGQDGPSASTTHNIYGVYDMSGGAYEYTMANLISESEEFMEPQNSGYTTSDYPYEEYFDKYSYGTSGYDRIRSKLGDAIREVYKSDNEGWYSDENELAYSDSAWFIRGGYHYHVTAGVFNSYYNDGSAENTTSSRLIITP